MIPRVRNLWTYSAKKQPQNYHVFTAVLPLAGLSALKNICKLLKCRKNVPGVPGRTRETGHTVSNRIYRGNKQQNGGCITCVTYIITHTLFLYLSVIINIGVLLFTYKSTPLSQDTGHTGTLAASGGINV